jgi:hypothetical protein
VQTDSSDGSFSQQESLTKNAAGGIVESASASLNRNDPALLSVRANFANTANGGVLSRLSCEAKYAIPIPANAATCGCCAGAPATAAVPAMQSVTAPAAMAIAPPVLATPGFGPLASIPPADGFDAAAFDQKLAFVRGICTVGGVPLMNPLAGLRGALRTKGVPGSTSRAPVSFPVAGPFTPALNSLPPDEPLRDLQWGLLYLEATRLLYASSATDARVEFRESRSASASLLEIRLKAAIAKQQGLRYQEASVRVQGNQLAVTLRAAKEGAADGLECTMASAVAGAVADPRP